MKKGTGHFIALCYGSGLRYLIGKVPLMLSSSMALNFTVVYISSM